MIYRALNNIPTLVFPQLEFQEIGSRYNEEELQWLSDGITEDYMRSMELLDHLAVSYGFQYIYFWQPVVFTEVKLTDEEAKADPRVYDETLGKLYRMTTDSLAAQAGSHFFDLTGALRDRTKTYYIDFTHVSEEGNEVVATKMFRILEKEFLEE